MAESIVTPSDQAEYGAVFTRRWIVETILDLVGYTVDRDLAALTLVEPAAGSGAFLLPAVERLLQSAEHSGRKVEELGDCIQSWELQASYAATLRSRLHSFLRSVKVPEATAEDLITRWVQVGDFLLAAEVSEADVVVGNPP